MNLNHTFEQISKMYSGHVIKRFKDKSKIKLGKPLVYNICDTCKVLQKRKIMVILEKGCTTYARMCIKCYSENQNRWD